MACGGCARRRQRIKEWMAKQQEKLRLAKDEKEASDGTTPTKEPGRTPFE